MKPNEVRIGNLVRFDGRIFRIHTIAEEFPTLDTDEFGIGVVDWNNIQPYEIKRDNLVVKGFREVYRCSSNIKYQYQIDPRLIYAFVPNLENWGYMLFGSIKIPCHHYHQLQNIYYALTQNELDLTESI